MTSNHPQPNELYRHYKRGTLYRILCVATRESDLEPCVVYESLDPEAEHRFWIRTMQDFCAEVTLGDGSTTKRFQLSESASA